MGEFLMNLLGSLNLNKDTGYEEYAKLELRRQ